MRDLPPAPAHTISAALALAPASIPTSASRTTPASTSGFIASIPRWEMPDLTPAVSKNGKPERRRWNWNDVYAGGREWSFEEIRARREGWLDGVNRWAAMGAPALGLEARAVISDITLRLSPSPPQTRTRLVGRPLQPLQQQWQRPLQHLWHRRPGHPHRSSTSLATSALQLDLPRHLRRRRRRSQPS